MHTRIATLVLASFVCVSAARAQPPTYDLLFLGTVPGGSNIGPAGVNDHGVVVGRVFVGGFAVPFVASPTQSPTVLPALPGDPGGFATAVNNAGVIVGASGNSQQSNWTAVTWTPTPTGYLVAALPKTAQGVQPTVARALNEGGDVVGELAFNAGFTWSASTGTTPLPFGITGVASGVNEKRQIVAGNVRLDLDTLAVDVADLSSNPAYFTGINDAGLCTTMHEKDFGLTWAGIYEFGVGLTFYAIGAPGLVVGVDYARDVFFVTSVGPPAGFNVHYPDFGILQLQFQLEPAFAAWFLSTAFGAGISANGRVTCIGINGVNQGAVLLTPTKFHAILEGAPGAAGLPVLVGHGTLAANTPVTFKLSRAAPSAPLGFIAGMSQANLSFYGGTLVPQPTLVLTGLLTDAAGKHTLTSNWPPGLPSGTKLYLQEWIADATAPFGIAGSNALECVVP